MTTLASLLVNPEICKSEWGYGSRSRSRTMSFSVGALTIPDVSGLGSCLWLTCFLATSIPACLTTLCTSGVTPIGVELVNLVHTDCDWFRINVSRHRYMHITEGYQFCWVIGGAVLFIGWLLNIREWKCRPCRYVYLGICGLIFFCGAVLLAEYEPSMPLVLGVLINMAVVVLCRYTCLKDPNPEQFYFIISIHFIMISFVLSAFWYIWAFTAFLGQPHDYADIEQDRIDSIMHSSSRGLTFFILWVSPIMLAIVYLILGLFVFKRGQCFVPGEGEEVHMFMGVDGLEMIDIIYLTKELKFVSYVFIVLGFTVWVAASVAAHNDAFFGVVLRMCVLIVTLICLYLWLSIGPGRIFKAAREHPSVEFIMDLLLSDWMEAIFLALFWPVLPVYFSLEFIRQRVRRCLGCCYAIDNGDEGTWLTHAGIKRWGQMADWDWPSVLDKSINVGVGYFVLQVGATTGTTIFLAWLAQVIAPWDLAPILAVLFFVGLILFLIPVVPGLPIYLVSGILIVQKYKDDFLKGVMIGSVLCWAIKLTSNVLLMKCVGEPFADNVRVRMMVGTHTPTMRAAEMILTRPGLTLPKVSVLVGGPDWPTAVLCAMLKVPVSSMLVGISPVIVLIVPVVVAAAYTLEADRAKDAGHVHEEMSYTSLSTNFIMLSAVVQMGSMVVAGIFLNAVKVSHEEELEREKESDKPVYEAVRLAEAEAMKLKRKTAWELMPCIVKIALVLGSWSTVGMMYIVLLFSDKALHSFSLTNKVCDLKDCNPIYVFKPLGFVSVGFLGISVVCKMIYRCWWRWKVSR